ncbi:unnamed protein product [Mycena citricolor]|uniref:Uncharacterized protein n=1 Tax=Mycena citricolor TaxID=2018698 RepID=A0AAD2H9W6_9AGAR|nr:unnamed protein product [Mycena citricolor]
MQSNISDTEPNDSDCDSFLLERDELQPQRVCPRLRRFSSMYATKAFNVTETSPVRQPHDETWIPIFSAPDYRNASEFVPPASHFVSPFDQPALKRIVSVPNPIRTPRSTPSFMRAYQVSECHEKRREESITSTIDSVSADSTGSEASSEIGASSKRSLGSDLGEGALIIEGENSDGEDQVTLGMKLKALPSGVGGFLAIPSQSAPSDHDRPGLPPDARRQQQVVSRSHLGHMQSYGPGRTINMFYQNLGYVFETKANQLAHQLGYGPLAAKKEIVASMGEGDFRLARLRAVESKNAIDSVAKEDRDFIKVLGKHCSALLRYTQRSEAVITHIQAFNSIFGLVGLYPGLRAFFLASSMLRSAGGLQAPNIQELWDSSRPSVFRSDRELQERQYWSTLAASALAQTEISELFDRTQVENLTACGSEMCAIEKLMISVSDHENAHRPLAIRCLHGILTLPLFWVSLDRRRIELVRKLCVTILLVLQDLDMDNLNPTIDEQDIDKRPLYDFDGLDLLISVVLDGMCAWRTEFVRKRAKRPGATLDPDDSSFKKFCEVVSMLRRPLPQKLLPQSSPRATGQDIERLLDGQVSQEILECHIWTRSPGASEKVPITSATARHPSARSEACTFQATRSMSSRSERPLRSHRASHTRDSTPSMLWTAPKPPPDLTEDWDARKRKVEPDENWWISYEFTKDNAKPLWPLPQPRDSDTGADGTIRRGRQRQSRSTLQRRMRLSPRGKTSPIAAVHGLPQPGWVDPHVHHGIPSIVISHVDEDEDECEDDSLSHSSLDAFSLGYPSPKSDTSVPSDSDDAVSDAGGESLPSPQSVSVSPPPAWKSWSEEAKRYSPWQARASSLSPSPTSVTQPLPPSSQIPAMRLRPRSPSPLGEFSSLIAFGSVTVDTQGSCEEDKHDEDEDEDEDEATVSQSESETRLATVYARIYVISVRDKTSVDALGSGSTKVQHTEQAGVE